MAMIDALVQELEQEARTTRRLLERVPNDQLGWKPHARSMSLGQLALHVARVPGALALASTQSPFQAPQFVHPSAASTAELIPALDESLATAKRVLGGMSDADLASTWRVVDGDRELMAVPRAAMLRSLMLNHWYHHRGQLSVYLRQLNVPLPSIYGPSADENPFTQSADARRSEVIAS
jgi:uncharacterized damage-inducible protein DinB